jgi:hypothetical protein
MKIRPVAFFLFHAERRTDGHTDSSNRVSRRLYEDSLQGSVTFSCADQLGDRMFESRLSYPYMLIPFGSLTEY